MDVERKNFLAAFRTEKEIVEAMINVRMERIIKNKDFSEKARKDGNALFAKYFHSDQDHENIFKMYGRSLTFAPEGSEELALAHGNRSAFLEHIKKYKECIVDVDRAIQITKSDCFKVKLLCRKANCCSKLGIPIDEILLEINASLTKVPESSMKKVLTDLVNAVKVSAEDNEKNSNKADNKVKDNKKELEGNEDIFEFVTIKHNEKYGRHLIANRNFKPGEIIYVEKFYASSLNIDKTYINCLHCFSMCWNGIPCDKCNWAMFCSEECKLMATKDYHDIECSIIPYLKIFGPDMTSNIHIAIRLLILALKEAGGSIDQLKHDIKMMDEHDENSEDFIMKNEIKKNFKTVYNLSSHATEKQMKAISSLAMGTLTSLAKYSSLFGKRLTVESIQDLERNENFIFIGSLFMKLLKIKMNNVFSITNLGTNYTTNDKNYIQAVDKKSVGCGMALVSTFLNHSCVPNVSRCFTKSNKIVIFAVKPIKKNSQLFDSYFGCSFVMPKTERQNYLNHYKFICDCEGCKNNWTLELGYVPTGLDPIEMKLFHRTIELENKIFDESKSLDQKIINQLSDAIIVATKRLSPTSTITYRLIDLLGKAYHKIFDFEKNIYGSCMKSKS